MADKRKLNVEIDKCIKKVTEGLDTFDDIWKKVHQSNNVNQKEKLEADLKKEIKKLQRLRDQIKTWLVSPDIKDKQTLIECRKNIEAQMEKFKVVEKEMKTKAYSKEGLVASGKVDPKEKEKEDILNWVSNAISNLTQQYDKLESECEALSQKKKLDREDTAKFAMCRLTMDHHKNHINKLESILRLVDNSAIQFEQIQSIKELVEYYVENNQDMDYESSIMMYDDLDLNDSVGASTLSDVDTESGNASVVVGSPLPTAPANLVPTTPLSHHKTKEEDSKKRQKANEDSISLNISSTSKGATKTTIGLINTSFQSIGRSTHTPTKLLSSIIIPTTPQPIKSSATPPVLGYAQVASSKLPPNSPLKTTVGSLNGVIGHSTTTHNQPLPVSTNQPVNTNQSDSPALETLVESLTSNIQSLPISSTTSNVSSSQARDSPTASSFSSILTDTTQNVITANQNGGQLSNFPSLNGDAFIVSNLPASVPAAAAAADDDDDDKNLTNGTSLVNGYNDIRHLAQNGQELIKNASSSDSVDTITLPNSSSDVQMVNGISHIENGLVQTVTADTGDYISGMESCLSSLRNIRLDNLHGVSPLGPLPLSSDDLDRKQLLDFASSRQPLQCDSEKVRVYLPNNPCKVPSYYPNVLPPAMNYPDFFSKLEPVTLFFVFYYMEGTKAQYLAAKALKQKSWRFHTKYLMWFQRHEEPKTITDEYEQGTYIFFDFEKWVQRKKEGFKFEYRFLEDHQLH